MNQDELARAMQNEKIRSFAQSNIFGWDQSCPHMVRVGLLSYSEPVLVDLSAADPSRFFDVVLNQVFKTGKMKGEREFRTRVVELFVVKED